MAPSQPPSSFSAIIPIFISLTIASFAHAQQQYYAFSGAIQIVNGNNVYACAGYNCPVPSPAPSPSCISCSSCEDGCGSGSTQQPATPAVCPANAPVSCNSIGQPDWCCSSGQNCGLDSAGRVACCPTGCQCTGKIGQEQTTTYYVQPTTSVWQPSTTTYYQQQTTYYQQQPTTAASVIYIATTEQIQQGGFCSTLFATGPGLPTQRSGDCGTILVAAKGVRVVPSVWLVSSVVVAGVLMGAFGFWAREWRL